jgi:hypothetical protein
LSSIAHKQKNREENKTHRERKGGRTLLIDAAIGREQGEGQRRRKKKKRKDRFGRVMQGSQGTQRTRVLAA